MLVSCLFSLSVMFSIGRWTYSDVHWHTYSRVTEGVNGPHISGTHLLIHRNMPASGRNTPIEIMAGL